MSFTANDVSALRKQTNAGMMDCKKALTETNGNFEEAVDWLRKKGLSAVAKKSGNVTAEGAVAVYEGNIVEINSQTDFVARNDKFQAMCQNIVKLVSSDDIEKLKASSYPGTGRTVSEEIAEHIAIIGENMNLRRADNLSVNQGVVASYVHNAIIPNLGRIGVLIALESSASTEKLTALGKQLAMHIAAAKPESLTIENVDPSLLDREKQIFSDQAKASGKPDSIIEKMVEGRIRKYYEEIVLLEQIFVIDGKTKISDLLAEKSKEFGSEIKIKDFVRFSVGEGIEQQESNFAEEVKAVSGVK